jgi:SAM-dependent methyltransferase
MAADPHYSADGALGYDEVPYPSAPYPYSHCDHLAMVGRLFGIDSADVRRCRVLEVGCADGANLIPMALALPDSQFLGIDLSARQIAAGRELIGRLGLRNIDLRQRDLTEIAVAERPFDYVIAQGVYSWTRYEVQQGLLQLCRRCLAPEGIAFVSYNVYPGWQQQKALREWLLHATGRVASTAERMQTVRHLMSRLRNVLLSSADEKDAAIAETISRLESWSDGYLRHDLLEDSNEPVYVAEFVRRVENHGLRFFAEADVASMAGADLPNHLCQATQQLGGPLVGREQLLDLLTQRTFRQSLLCHGECQVRSQLDVDALCQMYVASTLRRQSSAENSGAMFCAPGGAAFEVAEPAVATALDALQAAWPGGVWFRQLAGGTQYSPRLRDNNTRDLANVLLAAFVERAVVLHTVAPPVATAVTDCPVASPLARLQAASHPWVTSLRHDTVRLDAAARWLLVQLDGNQPQSVLKHRYLQERKSGEGDIDFETLLDHLLQCGLLMRT